MLKSIYVMAILWLIMPSVVSAQSLVLKNPHPSSFGVRQGISFGVNGNGFIGLFDTGDSCYFWKYTPGNDTWTRITNMPGPKRVQYSSGFVINDNIYVVGGSGTPATQILRGVYEYNTITGVWSVKNMFPDSGRVFGIGFGIGNKGYFGLGTTSMTSTAGFDNSFYEYDPINDEWTKVADFPGTARTGAFVFVLNGKAIVGGGRSANFEYFNDLWEYNPVSGSWNLLNQSMSAFPIGIDGSVGFSTQNNGYVACGALGSNTEFSKTIYSYDSSNNDFIESVANQLPNTLGRNDVCAFGLGAKGYIIGGWNQSKVSGYKDVYEFSPWLTGIHEEFKTETSIYPTPAKEKITINLNGREHAVQKIDIVNILGERQLSLSENFSENGGVIELDIRSLRNGIYFMNIEFDDERITKKLVVE